MGPIRTNTPVKSPASEGESNNEMKNSKKTPATSKQKAPYPAGKGNQKASAKKPTGEQPNENRRRSTRLSTPKPLPERDSPEVTPPSPSPLPATPADSATPNTTATIAMTANSLQTARDQEPTDGNPDSDLEHRSDSEHAGRIDEKNLSQDNVERDGGNSNATPETQESPTNAELLPDVGESDPGTNPWKVVTYKKSHRATRTPSPPPKLLKNARADSPRQKTPEPMDTTSRPASPAIQPEPAPQTQLDDEMDTQQTPKDPSICLPSIEPNLERARKHAREESPTAASPASSKIASIVANKPFTFRFKKLPLSEDPASPSTPPATQTPPMQSPPMQTPLTQIPSMQVTPAQIAPTQTPPLQMIQPPQLVPLSAERESQGGDPELDFEVSDGENDMGDTNQDDEGDGDIAAMVRDAEEFQPSFPSQMQNELYELLPTPNLDTIRPYRSQPLWATLHQDGKQKRNWLGRPGVKLIIHVWGNRPDPSINARLIHDMTTMIRFCLDLPSDSRQVCISPPIPAADVEDKRNAKHPYGFLVTEIDASQKAKLLDRRIWITRRMTLSFYDEGCLFDDFICMIGGLTANDPKDIQMTIQKALKHRDTQAIIQPMASAPGDPPANQAAIKDLHKRTLVGLRVKTIEIMRFTEGADCNTSKAFPHTFATIHMPSPTMHPLQIRHWGKWVNHVSNMKFSTTTSGKSHICIET
ncbi:hypothetical protein K474DRAFT_1677851 [Panus rudis PR-1116 ss-1]|nr:hypothetical protein K474DRAFT_1677851 [Panus rudis PR-1116 ss-1]